MTALSPVAAERRFNAKLRTAIDHCNATWRGMEQHLLDCPACREAEVMDHGACVACDTGRMVRSEWAMALARKTELERRQLAPVIDLPVAFLVQNP
jgi:hypothetical protein